MASIEVRDIKKTYRKGELEVPVLHGINVSVENGESVALMGPSGSGKTTLLNLIAGIDKPTSGSITIGGDDITSMSDRKLTRWRTTHVGYIFQLYHLIPVLTAYENVELPLTLLRMSKAERDRRVRLALKAVSLHERLDHYPRQLSGGQEQRVAIARAIVADPTVLIADEPTGDLDAESADETMTLLKRLNEEFGKTIVMVTHSQDVAEQAKRIIHLDKGYIRNDETAKAGA